MLRRTQKDDDINWVKEIQHQIKLVNRIFITNVRDEGEVDSVLENIVGKTPEILWMKEKSNTREGMN